MKRFSGIWQAGAAHHRTLLSVVDSTRPGSQVRRVNIRSYASEADCPKDDPEKFIDALYAHLGEGMEPEHAIAIAEAECPLAEFPVPKLLTSSAVANFDDDSQIIRAIERVISLETNSTHILVTRLGDAAPV